MKLRALCFLILLLGCSTPAPPTAPEQALVARVTAMQDACTRVFSSNDLTCGVYIILNDRSMGRLSEVRNGIPFVEAGIDATPERYALWLERMATRGLAVEDYVGPHDKGYEEAFYAFLGQDVPQQGTST